MSYPQESSEPSVTADPDLEAVHSAQQRVAEEQSRKKGGLFRRSPRVEPPARAPRGSVVLPSPETPHPAVPAERPDAAVTAPHSGPEGADDPADPRPADPSETEEHRQREPVIPPALSPESTRPSTPAGRERPSIPVPVVREQESASPAGEGGYVPPPVLLEQPHPRSGTLNGLPRIYDRSPDIHLDGADLHGFKVRGGSLRGDDHRFAGETRQDSMSIEICPIPEGPPALLVVAVSDGVGSRPLSHLGSREVCRYASRVMDEHLVGSLMTRRPDQDRLAAAGRAVAEDLADRLHRLAEHRRIDDPAALSCTFVAAAMLDEPSGAEDGERRAVVLSIGDSAAFILRDGRFEPVFDAKAEGGPEAMANAPVAALPANTTEVAVRIVGLRPADVLVIGSDGLSDPMRGNPAVQDRLAEWWSGPTVPRALEFGWQLSFNARTYGDDRTAICVWGR
jgi:serine/threonine protein phosphatase PrpC